jgi:hypothetical protein
MGASGIRALVEDLHNVVCQEQSSVQEVSYALGTVIYRPPRLRWTSEEWQKGGIRRYQDHWPTVSINREELWHDAKISSPPLCHQAKVGLLGPGVAKRPLHLSTRYPRLRVG